MFDSLWPLLLLLPLAAVSGWYAGRRDASKQTQSSYDLPSAYFKGLNFLLNEQPDKAIEVFIKVLEVDIETVEMHLALGNLFRRRGEVERATRIHQNLIARPNLEKQQRLQALFELGQDYLKAGLLDRAESLFQELADSNQYGEQALSHLVHIYEQEKEWDKAIAAGRKLSKVSGRDLSSIIAQYFCQLADAAIEDGDRTKARSYIQQALASDGSCVRATIQSGKLEVAEGDHRKAIRTWQRIENQGPEYLGEVVDLIAESYRALDDEAGLRGYLSSVLGTTGGIKILLALVHTIERQDGRAGAEEFLVKWVRKHPSIQGLYCLIELKLARAEEPVHGDLSILQGLIGGILEREQGYECRQCGYKAKAHHWQCPGCKGWTTIEPISVSEISDLEEVANDPQQLSVLNA